MSHQSDGRPNVELVDSLHDPAMLRTSCTGNGSVSVHVRILTGKDSENAAFILRITRPVQKVSGLSSECAVRRHWAVQNGTVKEHFYLGAMRYVRVAVRRNDQ